MWLPIATSRLERTDLSTGHSFSLTSDDPLTSDACFSGLVLLAVYQQVNKKQYKPTSVFKKIYWQNNRMATTTISNYEAFKIAYFSHLSNKKKKLI